MTNIVVPMAGKGSRFASAGYTLPKPLIEFHGHSMIEYVIKNIQPKEEHRFIFLCLQEHLNKFNLKAKLETAAPGCEIIPVKYVTEGAACTVLLAEKHINNDNPLMIANSDQFIDIDINTYLKYQVNSDGLIMTMSAEDSKWSYIKYDACHFVTEVREKQVISNEATVGIYNFRKGSDYVKYAKKMIEMNLRENGEFYVAPVYNLMIQACKKITYYNIGNVDQGMHGLGIPEDLERFIKNPLSLTVFKGK